ncbi:AsmA family protein [Commensalibacter communis]|uniref:hypothetical protein n=1 Tax=Commensalibacter communis TaxID=2972786 RepID=UPI00232EBE43|nr:hypothetical protein [Commensalibacter communis]
MATEDTKMTEAQSTWRQTHPIGWRILLGFSIFITTIIVFFCALFIFLNTQFGKNYVLTQIEKRTHGQVQIENISSFFSRQLTIADVKLKDPNGGVWLNVKQVKMDWSPWESFRNSKIIINSLIIKELDLNSFPSKRAVIDLSKDKRKPINLTYMIDLRDLQIQQLLISKNISPIEMRLAIEGKVLIRDLSKMVDTETLKAVMKAKPKLHLLASKRLPDFKFNGKVSGNLMGEDGKSASKPLHFSVMFPPGAGTNSKDKAEIYLDLGSDD